MVRSAEAPELSAHGLSCRTRGSATFAHKEKLKKIELLRYAEPSYKKYYKEKANEYFDEN